MKLQNVMERVNIMMLQPQHTNKRVLTYKRNQVLLMQRTLSPLSHHKVQRQHECVNTHRTPQQPSEQTHELYNVMKCLDQYHRNAC